MKNIKDQVNLKDKIVLLRLDLNVPLLDRVITDETRIDKIIPIINFLLNNKAKILILSHVGRPKGKKNSELSLKPICLNLEKKINKKIKLISTNLYDLRKNKLFLDKNEDVNLLENIRFYKEEEINDIKFAKHLASLGDLYVNDAFSCSHRQHASVSKITEFIPSYAGLQLQSEISALKKITSEIERPISCIIGGSKISTKIGLIKNLTFKLDNLIFVGGMANNILKFKGFEIGKSFKEDNCNDVIEEIFNNANVNSCKIYYPEDVSIGKNFNSVAQFKKLTEISNEDMILDIGPKTIKNINKIVENSKTIFWNGPAGYFENTNFLNGSSEIAKIIGKRSKDNHVYSVVGGGDTIAVINKTTSIDNFNFVSTAGGAFLEYLEGKELPGIKALN
tara:strand:- start:166 stop:1344 length:1179 start_codon:yes stop_codon:yes gene_type:complete